MSTPTVSDSVECKVTYNSDKVTVKSPKGGQVTVPMDTLRFEYLPLHRKLTRHCPGIEGLVNLTGNEMRCLMTVEGSELCRLTGEEKADKQVQDNTNKVVESNFEQRIHGTGELSEERNITRLEKSVELLKGEIFNLIYDIPTVKNEVCPNPSHILWHYGFRLNLSCWVLPKKSMEAPRIRKLLAHWREHNIETFIIPFAEYAVAQIRQIAVDKLQAEIIRAHTSLIERIDAASQRLREAEIEMDKREQQNKESVSWKERELADKARHNQVRAIIRQANDNMLACLDCARAFDETEKVRDLLNALRKAVETQALLFNSNIPRGTKPVELPVRSLSV
jgi:hypothetical protein